MEFALSFKLVVTVLNVGMAALMFAISRAPLWRASRAFGYVAVTAALYSFVDVVLVWRDWSPTQIAWMYRLNIFHGSLHAGAWLAYMFGGRRDSAKAVTPQLNWAIVAVVVPTAAIMLLADAVDPARTALVLGGRHGELRQVPLLTLAGYAGLSGSVLALLAVAVAHVREWLAGAEGAGLRAAGYLLFMVCVVNEVAVVGGFIPLPFLADAGFLFAVAPIAVQTLRRFRNDMARLAALSDELAATVSVRTAERDQAQGVLVRQERLTELGRLAAGVGHEVNNPLAYVSANLEVLRADPALSRRAALLDALDGVERIRGVVESLRSYASPGTGQRVAVAVDQIVGDALRVAGTGFRTRVAMVRGDVDGDLAVRGDAARLTQLLVNLLVNGAQAALDASAGRAPSVSVSVRAVDAASVVFEVIDSGDGFAEDVLERAGEPYVTTRVAEGGSGLGLFISQAVVREHGGDLHIDRAPLAGARVRVRLPRAPFPVEPPARWPTPPRASPSVIPVEEVPASARTAASRRLLLVDDEPLVVRALSRLLELKGLKVDVAVDGIEALERLAVGAAYDVVVTDLMMPGMSGIEFADRLATSYPALRRRLIVLTGGAVSAKGEAFLARRDLSVLHKPVRPEELLAAINTLLGAP